MRFPFKTYNPFKPHSHFGHSRKCTDVRSYRYEADWSIDNGLSWGKWWSSEYLARHCNCTTIYPQFVSSHPINICHDFQWVCPGGCSIMTFLCLVYLDLITITNKFNSSSVIRYFCFSLIFFLLSFPPKQWSLIFSPRLNSSEDTINYRSLKPNVNMAAFMAFL